jgi:hypothetical protein
MRGNASKIKLILIMLKFYRNLSKTKKLSFLITTIFLSFPLGAVTGFIIGLMATTFIPICCDGDGCHNCFEFNGMIGYEATGTIGFWAGLFLIPVIYISLIIYLETRK